MQDGLSGAPEPEPLIEFVPQPRSSSERLPASDYQPRSSSERLPASGHHPRSSPEPPAGSDHPPRGSPEPAASGPRAPVRAESLDRQLSLFGVEAAPPAPDDLEGLLAGPGEVVRMGGTARVSVVVDELWRARVLVREFALRRLAATCVRTAGEQIVVRTAYSTTLAPLAAAWLHGAGKMPPRGFGLDGRRLRLWVVAAGAPDELGFVLRLDGTDEPAWRLIGVALAAIGVPPVLLSPNTGGPAYRISGRKRLSRLSELVGDAPLGTPFGAWPNRDEAGRRDASHG